MSTGRLVARLLLLLIAPLTGRAQNVSEPALKAAFLLNFARFTEWPADALADFAPLVLCSADEGLSPEIERTVAGQSIQQHPVTLTRVTLHETFEHCAVLYVGRVDPRHAERLVDQLRGSSVLTVGDDQAFATAGGVIGLFVESGRMRFAINIDAAARSRLRLSAKLLSLAHIVKD